MNIMRNNQIINNTQKNKKTKIYDKYFVNLH